MDMLDSFVQAVPSGCLYHYTGAAGLIGIIQNRKFWASEYKHLNDRKEYRLGARLLKNAVRNSSLKNQELQRFHRLIAIAQKTSFILSFSERGDQLSQWRAYCPGGNGYALGFGQDNGLFVSAKQHSFNLVRCVYDPKKQQQLCEYLVSTFLEEMVNRQDWRSPPDSVERVDAFFKRYKWNLALALVVSALKHSGFREEKEWRLVSQYPEDLLYGVGFGAGRFGVTPHFELPICAKDIPSRIDQINIGPTSNKNATRTALDLLVTKHDIEVGRVHVSRIPLRQ